MSDERNEFAKTIAHRAALYNRLMAGRYELVDFATGLFTVRQWDGMDGCWCDCHDATNVSAAIALDVWMDRTANGTKRISFDEIDYYRIFPSDTRMSFDGSEGHEMFR